MGVCGRVAGGREWCQSDGMSFFDSVPQPPPPERVRRRRPVWMRSDAVIPGSVPGEVVLVRTGQVAVAIGSVRAYPNGFEFTLHTRLRTEDETGLVRAGPMEPPGRGREQVPEDVLRLGVMYADGRRAAAAGGCPRPGDDADGERLVVFENGGGGSARRWDGDFWVYPLPPAGPVTFVVSWLEHGVGETRAELDGAAIREAAGRAVILWPEEPEFEPGDSYAWRSHRITAGEPGDPGARTGPDRPGAEGAGGGG
jgi:hypothetical protein